MPLSFRTLVAIVAMMRRLARKGNRRKPSNRPFKQQKLPAWKPMITAWGVIPTCFIIGTAFIPIGISMIWFSQSVKEQIIPYTDCTNDQGIMCKEVIKDKEAWERNCTCDISFKINENWMGNVFIYYALGNFYQNHRRYIRSRDDNQLLGRLKTDVADMDFKCEPYLVCKTSEECCSEHTGGNCSNPLPNGTIVLPCGAIANSMFSDEIVLR